MSKCVFRVIDWWTYEICFRKHIRQFHFHPEHQVLEEYTLGRYEAGLEEVRELHGGDLLYVAQRYRGGTLCHLTGKERQAEIRYFCDPDAASIEIHGLREKQTCEYVVEVRSNLVCLDPAFTKRRRPIRVKCHRNATQDGTDNLGLISLDADSRRLLQLEPPQHQDRWPAKADATQAESKSPLANLFSDDGSAVLDAEDRYIRLFKAVGVTSRDIELYTKWKKLTASKSNKGGNAGHDGINKEVDPKEAANKKGKSGTKASGQTDDKNL